MHGDGPLNLLQLPAPGLPQVPVVLSSHCGQLCAARACGAPSLLRGVRAVAGRPDSHLPWCVHVVCAVNSLHPASPTPNPGSRWPIQQSLASSCLPGRRTEQAWLPASLGALRRDPEKGCDSFGREPDRVQCCLELQGAKAARLVFVPTSPTAVSRFPHYPTSKNIHVWNFQCL